jgi:hypothetical protein
LLSSFSGGTSNGQEYIAEATPGSCNWIFEEKDYKEWKHRHNGLLWITGKPGSGKSILLKHASLKEVEQHDQITISFFFHNSNSENHKTCLNMCGSFLHQLMKEYQDRGYGQLTDTIKSSTGAARRTVNHEEWGLHPNEQTRLLRNCISKVLEKSAVQIMVDALDEGHTTDRPFLEEFFKSLQSEHEG